MSMKKVVVGLLGCGNIGSGVVKLIAQMREDIRRHYQLEIEVRRALVRSTEKKRIPEVPASILTNDPDQVLNDPDISVVLEFLGGEQPAADYMARALRAGKSVVTANKMALALHWPELQRAAEESGSGFYYEASVGGAMPIIRMLQSSLQANHITRLSAIINGTTNYLLTRMTDEGMDYQTVLSEAQRLGLAEPDPAADVEGEDASYKLSILSSLAFHAHIPVSDIQREGMTHISQVDIKCAGDMGYVIKLVASASREEDVVDAFVSPVLVPKIHPLASVKGAFNAVYLHGHAFDDMMIYGRGAGSAPTASAIVSDLICAAQESNAASSTFEVVEGLSESVRMAQDRTCAFYLRLQVKDNPGVLAHVASCLSGQAVSVRALQQPQGSGDGAQITILTHPAAESSIRKAVSAFDAELVTVMNVLRVEE